MVTCSVFAPNPNRILDQILRNTTDRSASSEAAEQQEDEADHAAEDTRSEPTSIDRAAAAGPCLFLGGRPFLGLEMSGAARELRRRSRGRLRGSANDAQRSKSV